MNYSESEFRLSLVYPANFTLNYVSIIIFRESAISWFIRKIRLILLPFLVHGDARRERSIFGIFYFFITEK